MVEFQAKLWKKQKVIDTSVVPHDAPTLEETSDYQLNLIKACAVLAVNDTIGKSEGTEKTAASPQAQVRCGFRQHCQGEVTPCADVAQDQHPGKG